MDSVQTACDEKAKNGFVRVIMSIPRLQYKRSFKPFKFVKTARNADITTEFDTESFTVTVTGQDNGDLKDKNYQLHVKKLVYPIVPTESYVEPDKDRVLVFLKKADNKSWYPELNDGLEATEEGEPTEN